MRTKSALPWFGSDASVAKDLGALLNDCKHVTIPFCGGLSILPHLKAKAIVANDLHNHAVTFYDVMAGNYSGHSKDALIKLCRSTLSHPKHLETSRQQLECRTVVDRAWAFWAVCWIGRKGKGGTKHMGGSSSVRRTANGGNNATRIQSAAADLESWAAQFKRCEFECEDFREVLSDVADKPECGIYCDPPWFGAGRNYLHEFSDDDHQELAESLCRFDHSPIVVRYGDCVEVRRLYSSRHWKITPATSRTQANKSLGELWITRA